MGDKHNYSGKDKAKKNFHENDISQITTEMVEPKYFFMIPNILDELPLSPAAFRLYSHYKRVTGEAIGGSCWESSTTLAEKLRMSKSTITRAQRDLIKLGLITVTKQRKGHGEFDSNIVKIKNFWKANIDFFDILYIDLKGVVNPQEILTLYRSGKFEEANRNVNLLLDEHINNRRSN